jgi:tetratricopeptide (TPR) repeat protein
MEGDYSAAREFYEQALVIAREIGDRSGEGLVLGNLGWIAGVKGDYTTAHDYSERQLRISRQVGNRHLEAYALINLSFTTGALGDFNSALGFAEQGLALSQEIGNRSAEAWSLTCLGNSNLELNDLETAFEAHTQALQIRQSLAQPNLATEPLSGLARVALAHGDTPEAMNQVNRIIDFLDNGGTLEGTEEPLRVYLTCYQVLLVAKDQRAADLLNTAHDLLQTRIAEINNDTLRQSFLENIPHNREILSAWNEHHDSD